MYGGFIVGDACFSVATWLLAHNYYVCSTRLKHVVEEVDKSARSASEKQVKAEAEVKTDKFYWVMLVLNITASAAWGTFRLLKNLAIYF